MLACCSSVGVDILAELVLAVGEEEWNGRASGWQDRSKVEASRSGDRRGLGAAAVLKVRVEVLISLGKRVGLRSMQRWEGRKGGQSEASDARL